MSDAAARDAKICALRRDRVAVCDIMARLGLSRALVQRVLRAAGLTVKRGASSAHGASSDKVT